MLNSGIVAETPTEGIHRNYKLQIIVFYCSKVAKFPFNSVIGSKQICHLNIYPLVSLSGDKVHFSGSENADRNIKPFSTEMIEYNIFHDLFNTAPDIRAAKIIADTMVGEIVFVIRFKEHLAMYIETPDRNCEESITEISEIVRNRLITYLFAPGGHIPYYICNRYRLPDIVSDKT